MRRQQRWSKTTVVVGDGVDDDGVVDDDWYGKYWYEKS